MTFTLKSKEKSSIQITRPNCEVNINIDLKAKLNVCHFLCFNSICNNETVRLYNTHNSYMFRLYETAETCSCV